MVELPERLEVGIPSIDEEHRALLDQLNGLFAHAGDTPQSAEFSEALSRLTGQLIEHFASEERVMRTLEIPGVQLARHMDAHNEVIEQITQLSFDLMRRKFLRRDDVIFQVREWIVGHLADHDLDLRRFVRRA